MSSEGAPSPARLARKAAELVEECNYDLACKFLTRALETSPSDPTLLDALADVYLQLGNMEAAGMLLDKSARVAPDAGAAKWLSLGQLRQGEEAAACYQRGIAILNRELSAASGNGSSAHSSSPPATATASPSPAVSAAAITEALASAHCSIVELYMTDLCDKEGAEACCEEHIARALQLVPQGFEPNAMAASLRLVQQRRQDAAKHIDRAITTIMPSAGTRDSSGPSSSNDDEVMVVAGNVENLPLPLRFSAAKSMLELDRYTAAASVMEGILHEDDSDPEVWCVLGVTYQRLGELDVAKQYFERTLARIAGADTDPELARQRTHVQGLLSQVTAEIAKGTPDAAGGMEVDA
eukprot:g28.t1